MTAAAHLEVAGLSKSFGAFRAVEQVSFDLARGERLALLGPSGCGKTTMLNMIAGFVPPSAGVIRIDGRDISAMPPHRRNMGVVFQNYALFPHLTVAENVNYGLRMRRIPRAEAAPAVRRALEVVRLSTLGARYPHQLSGGQQQRAAIARAIAIQPEILLLDEPLSNLDAKLRESMRTDLLEILDSLSITTILVTHDQAEALALSHRVAILNAGGLEQLATAREAYENPATAFVAGFLGESTRIEGVLTGHTEQGHGIRVGGQTLWSHHVQAGAVVGQVVAAFLRADRISVGEAGEAGGNRLAAELRRIVYLGGEQRLIFETAIGALTVTQSGLNRRSGLREGEAATLAFDPADLIVLRQRAP